MIATSPTGGTSSPPAAGAPFTTVVGTPSRRESSWYFGDGAVVLNDTNTALRSTAKITTLDPVLGSSVARRQDGNSFGFRVSRRLTPRFAAEFSADYNSGHLTMSSAGLSGIEASRSTFSSAFNGLLSTIPSVVPTVASNSTIRDAVGHQIFTTGVLNINLKTEGKFIPYASVGGGMVVNRGDTPSATLVGNYRFPIAGVVPINETDTVNVRYTIDDHAFVGVLGGGFKYHISPRAGVRVDVRAHLSKNSINNLVDANPASVSSTPTGAIASFTTPSIQFSTIPVANAPSSLSGPAISSFRTFTGSGTQTQFSIVPGFFLRF